MSRAIRIDGITTLANGSVSVAYTAGQAPLPDEPSGMGISFQSKSALREFLSEADQTITDSTMMAFALASWFKADQQMTNLTTAKNRSASIDLSGAVSAVVLK